jgi:hypothetical protein
MPSERAGRVSMSKPIGQSTVIEGIDQAIQSIEEQIRS